MCTVVRGSPNICERANLAGVGRHSPAAHRFCMPYEVRQNFAAGEGDRSVSASGGVI